MVRKVRNAWRVDFQIKGVRYRENSPLNTRAGAEAYEASLRQRLSHGEDIKTKAIKTEKILFKDFANEWIETSAKTENKPSEVRIKILNLKNHLLPAFGRLELDAITVQLIEQYKAQKIKSGLSAKTVNNHLVILMRCLRVAVDWGRLDHVPRVNRLKAVSQRLDFLTPLESRRLIETVTEPMWREMLLTALRTGMRLGELFGLDWQDIDFQRKIVAVRRSIVRGIVGTPKNNKTRYIPLSDDLCRMIYERRQSRGLVFHRGDGTPLSHSIAGNAIHRACKQAGIRRIGWHTLRHSFASQLVSEGVPLNAVQELLGHSSIVMTMRYAHLAPSALRSAIDVLEKAEARDAAQECHHGVTIEQILTAAKRPS